MPVVALILSTLAFWLIYWFIRMGGLDHIHSIFARRREDARRVQARDRERTGALRAVDDPREAATVLMLLMARVGGDPTREHTSPSSGSSGWRSASIETSLNG